MTLQNKLSQTQISFEFFPPKTDEGVIQLQSAAKKLSALQPKYFSVTYGAGGSTQERTVETVITLQKETQISTAPHISCIGSTRAIITKLLNQYRQQGIHHLVALRGDLPSGMGGDFGEFHYARDLVAFIREQTGNYFHIEVAAYPEYHPQTTNPDLGLKHFQAKVLAGANSAITQYFYNADAYFQFLEAAEKLNISIPIVPGIMPITNYKQLARFSEGCGTEIPRWLHYRLENYGDDLESIRAFGEEFVTQLCERLLQAGAPGLHFYTLNRAEASIAIMRNLQNLACYN